MLPEPANGRSSIVTWSEEENDGKLSINNCPTRITRLPILVYVPVRETYVIPVELPPTARLGVHEPSEYAPPPPTVAHEVLLPLVVKNLPELLVCDGTSALKAVLAVV